MQPMMMPLLMMPPQGMFPGGGGFSGTGSQIGTQSSHMDTGYGGAGRPAAPPGFLYKVKCAFQFKGDEYDELNLDPGDVVDVIAYDKPELAVSSTLSIYLL